MDLRTGPPEGDSSSAEGLLPGDSSFCQIDFKKHKKETEGGNTNRAIAYLQTMEGDFQALTKFKLSLTLNHTRHYERLSNN